MFSKTCQIIRKFMIIIQSISRLHQFTLHFYQFENEKKNKIVQNKQQTHCIYNIPIYSLTHYLSIYQSIY